MSPLTPKLLIAGFFGLVYGLLGYFFMLDVPDAPRWGLVFGLSAFALLLLVLLLNDERRARRYARAEVLLPGPSDWHAGANIRMGKKVAGVRVYLCGKEMILLNVEKREPQMIRISPLKLRCITQPSPVELLLTLSDGRELRILSPYMEELVRRLRMAGWAIDARVV